MNAAGCRHVSPIVIAPVTAIVGLGLLEYGFPGIGKCVEIGIPALLFILLFSQVGTFNSLLRCVLVLQLFISTFVGFFIYLNFLDLLSSTPHEAALEIIG
jgi:hypothetical protein